MPNVCQFDIFGRLKRLFVAQVSCDPLIGHITPLNQLIMLLQVKIEWLVLQFLILNVPHSILGPEDRFPDREFTSFLQLIPACYFKIC